MNPPDQDLEFITLLFFNLVVAYKPQFHDAIMSAIWHKISQEQQQALKSFFTVAKP